MRLIAKNWRGFGLLLVTGIVVAFAHYRLQFGQAAWESLDQIFIWWFVHTGAVVILIFFAVLFILMSHEFFIGSKFEGSFKQLFFLIIMTVLVGSVCLLLFQHTLEGWLDSLRETSALSVLVVTLVVIAGVAGVISLGMVMFSPGGPIGLCLFLPLIAYKRFRRLGY